MRLYFLCIVFLAGFSGCSNATDPGYPSPLQKSITVNGVEYSAGIPVNKFLPDDTLHISFRVANQTLAPKTFNFSNIQQLAFELINKDNQIVLCYPYIVLPATSSFTVAPGEMKELSMWSLFRDHNGRYIEKGNYNLNVFLANRNSPKINLAVFIY